MAGNRDELEADFAQFYGLDLGGMGTDYSIHHAAVLAAHLPRGARCLSALDPDLAWSDETALLSSIQYLLRGIVWQLGGGKGEKPEPIQTPSEAREMREQFEALPALMEEVAESLHIDLGVNPDGD